MYSVRSDSTCIYVLYVYRDFVILDYIFPLGRKLTFPGPTTTTCIRHTEPMVTNPIYSGPVYETVPQGYTSIPLNSPSSAKADSPTPNSSPESNRYDLNPTSRTDILDLVRKTNKTTSPLTETSFRSASSSGNNAHRERNKLHLTLSLGANSNKSHGEVTRAKRASDKIVDDENYTIMSPVNGRMSLTGAWGESSSEMIGKSQE